MVPVRPPAIIQSRSAMKINNPLLFVSPKLSASSFGMPSRPMKRSRSRSGSRDSQVDRPLVSTLVFSGPSRLDSSCPAETGVAGSCEQHRCLPPETHLSHCSPGHGFLTAKVIHHLRGWLFDDSAVGSQSPGRYPRPTSTVL